MADTRSWRHFYKRKAWQDIKEARSREDSGLCRMCLPRTVVGTICDHIIPHRGDEALFFDYDNTQLLCKPCHDAEKQRLEVRGFSDRTDSEGYPIDPLHPANRLERRPV